MNIVVLDGYTANPGDLSWDGFKKYGDLKVYEHSPENLVIERIGDAKAIFTNKTRISKDIMDSCPNLKFIGVLATGYDVVDVAYAKEKGIIITNIPAYSTDSVAQFVFALILELCHRVGHHNHQVQKGRWSTNRDFTFWDYPLVELKGKTLGIIGYGTIGKATGELAKAFGMKVLATNSTGEGEGIVPLDALLSQSDIISLHSPLTDETRGLINSDTIANMKKGAILINTSRGPVVDEVALAKALKSGKLGGAAVDVVSIEPISKDNPLLGLNNCIITPHIAWATQEARQRLMDTALQNLVCFMEGKPQNVVNS